jgi:hypothetical protein
MSCDDLARAVGDRCAAQALSAPNRGLHRQGKIRCMQVVLPSCNWYTQVVSKLRQVSKII